MQTKRFSLHVFNETARVLNQLKPLLNHLGQPLPLLSNQSAELLSADLNEIDLSGRERLNESFIYCVISTFNNEEPPCELGVDIPLLIQWDQAYRLVPGPPHSVLQYGAILPLVDFLKGDWKDLPMNYCQTIEQMQEEETTLVLSNVIDKIQGLYKGFNKYEKFAVLLLFEFYARVSVSLPVLWVAGKMSSTDLQNHAPYFQNDKVKANLSKKQKVEQEFYSRRLENLKGYLDTLKPGFLKTVE